MADCICEPFQQMVESMEDESIGDVEPPFLVDISDDGEPVDELFAFVLEFFKNSAFSGVDISMDLSIEHDEKEDSQNFIAQLSPDEDALARMDDLLAIVSDDNMDALADIVVEWVL